MQKRLEGEKVQRGWMERVCKNVAERESPKGIGGEKESPKKIGEKESAKKIDRRERESAKKLGKRVTVQKRLERESV